ncbi:dynamitin domain-containing protein [Ditylenchus destructor]|uniref:Dynamitin domain-containing protein n=1 Tax=Ditylenchus destructor TaxID=166010 RepID=A0AAD4MV89_9BILA|nr:dynamitin domain-containing protein [Ditylenchus destructor]
MAAQSETVYETESVKSEEPIEVEEQFDNPGVEKIHVDVESAAKHFEDRLLNADFVDFSDTVSNIRKRGYKSGHYVLDIEEDEEEETIDQKFRRLRREVQELMDAVNMEREKPERKFTVNTTELENLRDLLKAAILKRESELLPRPPTTKAIENKPDDN